MAPRVRKYESGYEKRMKKKKTDEFILSQKGALENFVTREPQSVFANKNTCASGGVDVDDIVGATDNDVDVDDCVGATVNVVDDDLGATANDNVDGIVNSSCEFDDNVVANDVFESIDIFDPRNWDVLDCNMINNLVEKGPIRDLSITKGPKDQSSRRFSSAFYTRILSNREKCDREWLVYSKEIDKVFCFCCKIFKKGIGRNQLANERFGDWTHVTTRLREHECSAEHLKNMTTWYDLR
ncbi:unnamed protein product [Cuscuta europaea]|uniref:TTF-type domain-containing protein n=1 Tax=Cuscuta europaea TaxID=41803 RepID=A0A9P0Z0U7_CUSEU|nr:unnamed protein product [Cuscuta europaea]